MGHILRIFGRDRELLAARNPQMDGVAKFIFRNSGQIRILGLFHVDFCAIAFGCFRTQDYNRRIGPIR